MKKIFSITILIATLLVGVAFCLYKVYPTKYKGIVEEQAKINQVDQNLVFAIIKCESGFNAGAISDKGAVGLMQLMPETAEFIAQKLSVQAYDLTNAKDNVTLGVAYLRYLIDKFGEEVALYCYNAGEGRVKRYLDGGGELRAFPYLETTNYVKRVIRVKNRYSKLQKLPFRN